MTVIITLVITTELTQTIYIVWVFIKSTLTDLDVKGVFHYKPSTNLNTHIDLQDVLQNLTYKIY